MDLEELKKIEDMRLNYLTKHAVYTVHTQIKSSRLTKALHRGFRLSVLESLKLTSFKESDMFITTPNETKKNFKPLTTFFDTIKNLISSKHKKLLEMVARLKISYFSLVSFLKVL